LRIRLGAKRSLRSLISHILGGLRILRGLTSLAPRGLRSRGSLISHALGGLRILRGLIGGRSRFCSRLNSRTHHVA